MKFGHLIEYGKRNSYAENEARKLVPLLIRLLIQRYAQF